MWFLITSFSVAGYLPSVSLAVEIKAITEPEWKAYLNKNWNVLKCPLTCYLSVPSKERLYVVLMESVVPQHLVEELQVLRMPLVCYLLLPATCTCTGQRLRKKSCIPETADKSRYSSMQHFKHQKADLVWSYKRVLWVCVFVPDKRTAWSQVW